MKTLLRTVFCIGGREIHFRNEETKQIEIVWVSRGL
jgi:hypothetical protein